MDDIIVFFPQHPTTLEEISIYFMEVHSQLTFFYIQFPFDWTSCEKNAIFKYWWQNSIFCQHPTGFWEIGIFLWKYITNWPFSTSSFHLTELPVENPEWAVIDDDYLTLQNQHPDLDKRSQPVAQKTHCRAGKKLDWLITTATVILITGGEGEWETMCACMHSVSYALMRLYM